MSYLDENYIDDILAEAARQKPESRAAFLEMCELDMDQGYTAEVYEAARRYFNADESV